MGVNGLAQASEPKAPGFRYPSHPLPEGRGLGGLTPHELVTLPQHVCEPLTYPAIRTDVYRRETGFQVPDSFSFEVQPFELPGTGRITDPERCGSWHTAAVCQGDPGHWMRHIKHSCDNPACPVCSGRWASKQGARMAESLRGYIQAANRGQATLEGTDTATWHRDNARYLNHYVLSPREGEIRQDMGIDSIKAAGRRMAPRVGITGGIMIFHPYRIRKDLAKRLVYHNREIRGMNEDERDRKFWELVRADALFLGDWQAYVYWSPHFHIIGFGRLPRQITPDEKENAKVLLAGWIVKWVRHVSTEILEMPDERIDPIAELAAYLLTHAAYQPGKKIPARLGVCTSDKLVKVGKPINDGYEATCPKCGSPIVLGGFDADGNFHPQVDQEGAIVPYRVRYHWQRYEILKGPPR